MAMDNHEKDAMDAPNPGYEVRDVHVRKIVVYAAVLVVVIAVSMVAMKITFDYFARREAGNQPPPTTLASHAADQLPPEPRLQQNPLTDLRDLKAEEAALLTSVSWVDQKRGIVRIPVEEAMKLTVGRGLPHRDGMATPPAVPDGRQP